MSKTRFKTHIKNGSKAISGIQRIPNESFAEPIGDHSMLDSDSGQSTVEFAIVTASLLAILIGLAALWRAGQDGSLVELMRSNSSHSLAIGSALEAMQDALLY